MIHGSALWTRFQCSSNLPPLWFQTLDGKTTSNRAVELAQLIFPYFKAISPLIHGFLICLTKTAKTTSSLAPISLKIWTHHQLWWNHITMDRPQISLMNLGEFFDNNMSIDLNEILCQHKAGNMFKQGILFNYATWLLVNKYKQVNTNRVATNQKHLNINQHWNLIQVQTWYGKLFDWWLSSPKGPHWTLTWFQTRTPPSIPNPSFPWSNIKKNQHMVDIGILKECCASKWALPCFIVAKKDGQVIQISDLHSLNKYVKFKQYLLAFIHVIMQQISGYKYFTKLKILMQYCTFEFNEE